MAEDLTGRRLGRYQVTALVGRGGMATVYRATHPGLEQTVAIKVLHAHLATDPDMLGRFQREARAVAALRHSNIVHVVDFDCIDDVYFMVMEYVDGPTLSAHLREVAAGGGRLPKAEVLQLFEPLCSAVDYAHRQGMIHRDIKPSNVLLTAQGEPVLTDYGIAKIVGVTQHTATGTVMGSAYYMSPEQAQGIAVDGRTDIYSLGVMLFESLTGHVPYEGDTLATVLVKHITAPVPAVSPLNAELPPLIDGLMRVALAKDPGERFQTGQALAAALQRGLGPQGTVAPAAPVTETRFERPPGGGPAPQSSTRVEGQGEHAAAHDVFISYAASDKAVAEAVCATLEAEHVQCWMASRDVLPGQSYAQALVKAIHAARVFVLVFSSATNQSHPVERELDMAVTSRLPIIPLRVEDVLPRESIEYYLAGHQWFDALTPPLEDHLRRLAAAITALLQRSAAPAGRPSEAAAPEPVVWATGAQAATTYEPAPEPKVEAPAPAPAATPDRTTFEPPEPVVWATGAQAATTYEPALEPKPEPEPEPEVKEPEPEVEAPEPEPEPEPEVKEPEPEVEEPEPEPEVKEPEPEVEAPEPEPEPEPEVEAPEPEPPAPIAAPQAATTYEPPPEPKVEAPPATADRTTFEPPAPIAAPQAATTYEPPPEPKVEAPPPPLASLPVAGAVPVISSRDQQLRETADPSSRGIHKPTLFAAAAVGIAWIVILFVIDKVIS